MPRYDTYDTNEDSGEDFYTTSDLPMPDQEYKDPQGIGGFQNVGHATFATGDRIYSDDGTAKTRIKGNGNATGSIV